MIKLCSLASKVQLSSPLPAARCPTRGPNGKGKSFRGCAFFLKKKINGQQTPDSNEIIMTVMIWICVRDSSGTHKSVTISSSRYVWWVPKIQDGPESLKGGRVSCTVVLAVASRELGGVLWNFLSWFGWWAAEILGLSELQMRTVLNLIRNPKNYFILIYFFIIILWFFIDLRLYYSKFVHGFIYLFICFI